MIEPIYVVDTNALAWYLIESARLSARAKMLFVAAENAQTRLYFSAISLAELYYADQKWGWFNDFKATYNDIQSAPYLRAVAFHENVVLDFDRDQAIPEMHDRIIVGLARTLRAPLITSDVVIRQSGIVQVEW